MSNSGNAQMKTIKNVSYFALGFVIATLTISLTSVGASVTNEISRVFVENDGKNPIPIVSREPLKIKGKVEIDGKPEVKLDGDSKIKIESIDKPVTVRFDKNEAMPETEIFKKGKNYGITITGEKPRRCEVDRINGNWIYCKRANIEAEVVGWVNSAQLTHVMQVEQ